MEGGVKIEDYKDWITHPVDESRKMAYQSLYEIRYHRMKKFDELPEEVMAMVTEAFVPTSKLTFVSSPIKVRVEVEGDDR